jgi:hypothetical protein
VIAKPATRTHTQRRAALAAMRASGCTCTPAISIRHEHHVIAEHDNHCALMRSVESNGPPHHQQLVLYREEAFE